MSSRQKRRVPPPHAGLILGRTLPQPDRVPMGFHGAAITSPASDELIRYDGDGNLILIAPTGAGKTAGPLISNLLDYPGQVIALDIKGELTAVTTRRRQEFGPVYRIDLRNTLTHDASLNPLDMVSLNVDEPAMLGRSFAANLIDRSVGERDRFWNDWSETLIGAAIAQALMSTDPKEMTLSAVCDMFMQDDSLHEIATRLDHGRFSLRSSYSAMAAFLQLPDRETRPSVLGTVQSHLRLFDSDMVRKLTDSTSIDLDALVRGDPMTILLSIPPDRITAYAPLLRLWFSGLINLLTHRTTPPPLRTVLMLDEAAQVGRMDAFVTASTLMRSWGITLWSAWQNASQLEIYGPHAKTLIDNAAVIQFFGVRNRRSAAEFAALVGGIDADSIMRMTPDEQLLLIEGGEPVKAAKLRYWEEAMFNGLHDPNPLVRPRAGRGR